MVSGWIGLTAIMMLNGPPSVDAQAAVTQMTRTVTLLAEPQQGKALAAPVQVAQKGGKDKKGDPWEKLREHFKRRFSEGKRPSFGPPFMFRRGSKDKKDDGKGEKSKKGPPWAKGFKGRPPFPWWGSKKKPGDDKSKGKKDDGKKHAHGKGPSRFKGGPWGSWARRFGSSRSPWSWFGKQRGPRFGRPQFGKRGPWSRSPWARGKFGRGPRPFGFGPSRGRFGAGPWGRGGFGRRGPGMAPRRGPWGWGGSPWSRSYRGRGPWSWRGWGR